MTRPEDAAGGFPLAETTVADIHAAYASGELTARSLVERYLERIRDLDQRGPRLNSIICTNPDALGEADRLDAAHARSGPVGPLHGVPLVMKDQADVLGMPTTMGSVLFRGHMPGRDCFVAARLRRAGAVFIGKATLGEMGAGDTHGSLFGSTRNPYDLERTAGGSSGGSAAATSANLALAAIGQEGFASIRRPAAWSGIVGMRPTAGLVSRGGVYAGWPSINGSLGPMARRVEDAARLLDCMVGFDPGDPLTGRGFGTLREGLPAAVANGADALAGARIGVLREPMGHASEPDSEDFAKVDAVFARAVGELAAAGADLVDPVAVPGLNDLLAQRAGDTEAEDEAFRVYAAGSAASPFASRREAMASPLYGETFHGVGRRWGSRAPADAHSRYLRARDELMTRLLAVMAEHRLEAVVHKSVEHQPTLIEHGVNPPWTDQKGAPHLNTFLVFVPSVTVPAGLTADGLPAGITFLGRPYSDGDMLRLAYAYELATGHRRPPPCAP